MERSGFKEEMPYKDALMFVMLILGVLCVMTGLTTLMLELLAGNWDYQALVNSF